MYKIGELSKLCSISVKALRYYDAEGLLVPDEIDIFTGYRYYSASKLEDCYRIIALKELGFSLGEIKARLAARDSAQIDALMKAKAFGLRSLIESAEKQLRRIESMRNNLTEGELRMFDIIVKSEGGLRAACLRGVFEDKSSAMKTADEIAGALPRSVVGKRRIIINYEIEYREEAFDLAACAELTGDLPAGSEYCEKNILLNESAASLVCKISELDEAYWAMIKFVNESDYKICGAYCEIYHDDGTVELKVPICGRAEGAPDSGGNMPFTDDAEVLGKWRLIDIIPTREHFSDGRPKCTSLPWQRAELYFIDGGKGYWTIKGWTKGYLLTRHDGACRYTLENRRGRRLMFLEMNVGRFTNPDVWVYEKVGDKRYASPEEFRITDDIDRPFVGDSEVLGAWRVRDFVVRRKDFDPNKQNWANLFARRVEFREGGEYLFATENSENNTASTWTKGFVLNKSSKTASAYEIRRIDGREYLFVEWKSGDYSFAGRTFWYVFTRE